MKLRWVTYWFRLQNATLFFYTKKNGCASHLRGLYYIYTMQSVREVSSVDGKRFMFELIMANGKRKMLAAETAALRKQWVGHLWQAMNLCTSGIGSVQSTNPEACKYQDGLIHSEDIYSDIEKVTGAQLPLYPSPPGPLPPDRGPSPPSPTSEQEAIYQNTVFTSHWAQESSVAGCDPSNEVVEGDYDVLPVRNHLRNLATETDDGYVNVYDSPASYRKPADHQEENLYDVPSLILRKLPNDTTEQEEELYWKV